MDLDIRYNTDITIREDWIEQNIPADGALVVNYEVQHKGLTDVNVRLSSPKKFPHSALNQLRKYPRYYARRFNLWWLYNVDENYRDHLRSLQVRECRKLDDEFAKQAN